MKPSPRLLGALMLSLAAFSGHALADTVTVYSARNEQLLKPLLDRYTKETGTEIKLLTANEGALLARLNAEGPSTPADVLITVDAGNLWLAAQQGHAMPASIVGVDYAQGIVIGRWLAERLGKDPRGGERRGDHRRAALNDRDG